MKAIDEIKASGGFKECPFCGGNGKLITEKGGYRICCERCFAGVRLSTDRISATKAWNERLRDDKCVMCGDYVPEGRWVCPSCEADPFHALKKKGGAL